MDSHWHSVKGFRLVELGAPRKQSWLVCPLWSLPVMLEPGVPVFHMLKSKWKGGASKTIKVLNIRVTPCVQKRRGGIFPSSRQIYCVWLLQSLQISRGGNLPNSTRCGYGSGRDQNWKVSCAVAILQNLYPPKRLKVNWATWQLTAALNLNVFCHGFFFPFLITEELVFFKDSDFLNWHWICRAGSYNLRKNVWMKEIQWKEAVCVLKAIIEKFYPKRKYSFCLLGLLSFMSFYLDFIIIIIIITNNSSILYWNSKFLATGQFWL